MSPPPNDPTDPNSPNYGFGDIDADKKVKGLKKLTEATKTFSQNAVAGANKSLTQLSKTAGGVFDAFGEGLDFSITGLIKFALKIDQARAELMKATGAAEGLNAAMKASRKHTRGLAIRMEQLYGFTKVAYENIAAFSEATEESQGAMIGATAALTKLGVAEQTTAKNLNSLTKGLGMTGVEASKVTMDLAKVAKSLGSFMTPGKIAEEFSKALPKLAVYGKGATNEFYKLAGQAKATGLEIGTLLGVAGKFDTFEDAANNTAQLNALLGTQLNSVDMLTASDGERLEMMKESFDQTGKSWEGLDRFEKKQLAQAAGFQDVQKAAQFFGTEMEDLQEAQEAADPALVSQNELNDAMEKGVSTMERWAAMLEGIKFKLIKIIMPHVMKFFTWMTSAPKGKNSPLDNMVKVLLKIGGYFDKYILIPMGEIWDGMSTGSKDTVSMIMGIVLALGPIIGIATTILGIFGAILNIPVLIASALGGVIGYFWDDIQEFWQKMQPYITMLTGYIASKWEELKPIIKLVVDDALAKWEELKPKITKVIDKVMDKWDELKPKITKIMDQLKPLFGKMEDWMTDPIKAAGNLFTKVINQYLIGGINDAIREMWVSSLPNSVIAMLPSPPQLDPLELDTLHEGGPLVGPAKVRSDEYIIMPPANAPAGQVLTPQQMGNTDDKPVTVVINIDGREFVRQTVFPVLNKEFNLQGIG